MKKMPLSFVLMLALMSAALRAMPPLQHALKGTVRAVNVATHVLTLEPGEKDSPTEFDIVDGRTRLLHDGKPATLADLSPGLAVQLYYKQEQGRTVATEVNWNSSPAAKAKS